MSSSLEKLQVRPEEKRAQMPENRPRSPEPPIYRHQCCRLFKANFIRMRVLLVRSTGPKLRDLRLYLSYGFWNQACVPNTEAHSPASFCVLWEGLRERDLLFQTLDTTMRRVKLPSGGQLQCISEPSACCQCREARKSANEACNYC